MRPSSDIIREAAELPVELRILVVDSLLKTLNPPIAEIDRQWMETAKRRLTELRSGTVRPVPGEDVITQVRKQLKS